MIKGDGSRTTVSLLAVLLVAVAVSTLLDAPSSRAFPPSIDSDVLIYPTVQGLGDVALVDMDGLGYKDFILSIEDDGSGMGALDVWYNVPGTDAYAWNSTFHVPKHIKMIAEDLDGLNGLDVVMLEQNRNYLDILFRAGIGLYEAHSARHLWAPDTIDIAVGDILTGVFVGPEIVALHPAGVAV